MDKPLEAGQVVGNYRVLAALGAGGMGVVYRARDERLGRDVALKVLPAAQTSDPTAKARMLREAQTASALNHPHICHIYEIGEAAGQNFIAMELVEGRALSASIPQGGLPIDMATRYAEQMADALEHAHSRSVLHRDIKSSNVVVTPEGRVKILDFGLAKRVTEDIASEATLSQVSPLTQAGSIAGTLSYLAPEVLSGHPAEARSDLWALGVVLYEMASGTLPFQGRSSFEVSAAILRESPKPLPARVPPGLRAVIQRCLAKEPAQRYQRASEVRAALEAIGSASSGAQIALQSPVATSVLESTHAPPSILKPREAKSGVRSRVLFYVGVIAMLTALGLGVDFILKWEKTKVPSGSGGSEAPASELRAFPPPPAGVPANSLTGGGKPSSVAEANEYFEKSMLFMRGQFDPQRARPLLEKALELDPKFAEARAMRALMMLVQVESGVANESAWIYKAGEETRQALVDDPSCASAHAILAAVYYYQGRTEDGLRSADAGLKLLPQATSANIWKVFLLRGRGDTEEAKRLAQDLNSREPTFFPARIQLALILNETGDRAGAARELGKVIEIDAHNNFALCQLAHMHIENNDLKTARGFLDDVLEAQKNSYRVRILRGLLYAAEGKRRNAEREMDPQTLKYAEVNPGVTLHAAEYFALLDDVPQALTWLEKAVRNGDERIAWFKADPLLAKVREQARFQQIVDSIAFRRGQK